MLCIYLCQVKKSATSDKEACRTLCILGRMLFNEGTHLTKQEEAICFYEEASKLDPTSLSCAYRYGILLFRARELGKTVEVYEVRCSP